MGTIRKYGLAFIILLALGLSVVLPDFILRFIPSPTGNPLDIIFITLICLLIFVLYKG